MSYKAGQVLFERLTFAVLRAPLRWIDTVPVGRILNRFTADFNIIDSRLAMGLSTFIGYMLQVIGICAASMTISPYIILLAAACVAWNGWIAITYLEGARPAKRLDSTAKSPIFELFGSVLTGISCIRGFDKSTSYIQRMNRKLDDYIQTSWYTALLSRWLAWRMSLTGSFFTVIVGFIVIAQPFMSASLTGFVLSFTLTFAESVLYSVQQYATVELEMNATERVIEYCELKTEDYGGKKPPAAWPTEGRLEVDNLVVAYAADLPPVLKGLTFSIRGNERVGVVGRTGAGKSSLTLALFRFLEARSGTIHIDGLDIAKIPLPDLRSRLAIIPQVRLIFPAPFSSIQSTNMAIARIPFSSPARSGRISIHSTIIPMPSFTIVSRESTSSRRETPMAAQRQQRQENRLPVRPARPRRTKEPRTSTSSKISARPSPRVA